MPYTNALNDNFVDLMFSLRILLMVIVYFFPNEWWWLLTLRWFYLIDPYCLYHKSWCFSHLVFPTGQAYFILWCLLSLWDYSFHFTMFTYPFYVLSKWLSWSSFMTRVKEDGGRWVILNKKGHLGRILEDSIVT